MRRKDRELTNRDDIISIMKDCDVCRIGFADQGVPYIVPLNFGMVDENDQLTLYFHGASNGRKVDLAKTNPTVCFEMDCGHELCEDEKMACEFTMEFRSVIGYGQLTLIKDMDERKKALNSIMLKYTEREDFEYHQHYLEQISVFKLVVSEMSGKQLVKM